MGLDDLIKEGLSEKSVRFLKLELYELPKEAEEHIKNILISAGKYGGEVAQYSVVEGLFGISLEVDKDDAWKSYIKPLASVANSCPELIGPAARLYIGYKELFYELRIDGVTRPMTSKEWEKEHEYRKEVINRLGEVIERYAPYPDFLREVITQLYSMLYSAKVNKRRDNIMKAMEVYNDDTIQSLLIRSPPDLRGMIYRAIEQAINKGEDPKDRAREVAEKYYVKLEKLLDYWKLDDRSNKERDNRGYSSSKLYTFGPYTFGPVNLRRIQYLSEQVSNAIKVIREAYGKKESKDLVEGLFKKLLNYEKSYKELVDNNKN